MTGTRNREEVLGRLPPPWPDDLLPGIRSALAAHPRKVWILDDDPTGTQTISGLPVITTWTVDALREGFEDPLPACFILTNSRALPSDATRKLHEILARNLQEAAAGRPFSIISRSDSTLRGHFLLENDALAGVLGAFDLTLIAPYFEAGGRLTIDDIHYVAEGETLVPAAGTAFAQDPVFGYRESHLARWIEEKSAGRIPATDVVSLSLSLIRRQGPSGVERVLRDAPSGSVVIANAVEPSDIEVVASAVMAVEAGGRRILARTAAAFVAARAGQRPPPPLDPGECADPAAVAGGLAVVGSHVPKTTAQLENLLAGSDIVPLELAVDAVMDARRRPAAISNCSRAMNDALAQERDVVVFTSRRLARGADVASDLEIGSTVSRALVEIVRNLRVRPRYLIAKGGITSSDLATRALDVRRSLVLGQLLPGVPVWLLGAESRFPGLPYVIFPGNVGGPEALAAAVRKLSPPPPCSSPASA